MTLRGKLLIVMASHTRRVELEVPLNFIMQTLASLHVSGWEAYIQPIVGNADLCGCRNRSLMYTVADDYTHLLLLDNDVAGDPGTVERLLSWNVDLVFGAYPKREEPLRFTVRTLPSGIGQFVDPHTRQPRPDGLAEVAGGPTGLMLLSRRCVEKMLAANADNWYADPFTPQGRAYDVFRFAVESNERFGEDHWFCEQWRRLGGDVWCDPHLTLRHYGDKTYEARFADTVMRSQLTAKIIGAEDASPIDAESKV